ncbi:MAG: esterase [Anaerolineales bacterium]|nr:esterase [Anaerolineales bacterium]
MKKLITTLGPYRADQLGMILPHEHIFVDLSPIEEENWKAAKTQDVVEKMSPELVRAKKTGVTALVECTPVGVGRRADIVRAVSEDAGVPVVVPTGIYREPWIPQWAHNAPLERIQDWMTAELNGEIEESGVRAGWIKLSAGDQGLTKTETKILRAAARAGKTTGALIGSHTIKGSVVKDQIRIIQEEGYSPDRFLWIHTQAEEDFTLHLEIAQQGAWIEYDSIGNQETPDGYFLDRIFRVVDAGYGRQLLLSHDRGWYDPSQPGGGEAKPYTYLSDTFLPALEETGLGEKTISALTQENPFRAFAR